ncbi:MAG TPA: twin-arginine translocase TatA/TatE family subunit [Rhizomicrobium sp.]|jgi:sec-independent protein translocase protein TatA|nr:twin-arginine translocase TatA/TatE family subunit [Rhizomicrobium sp.]
MGALSIWHVLLIAAMALLLFGGGGKLSSLMGDLGEGIANFRKGLSEEPKPVRVPEKKNIS